MPRYRHDSGPEGRARERDSRSAAGGENQLRMSAVRESALSNSCTPYVRMLKLEKKVVLSCSCARCVGGVALGGQAKKKKGREVVYDNVLHISCPGRGTS